MSWIGIKGEEGEPGIPAEGSGILRHMSDEQKAIKLTVTFEAKSPEALKEAVESFLEDLNSKKAPSTGASMSTTGWQYDSKVTQ